MSPVDRFDFQLMLALSLLHDRIDALCADELARTHKQATSARRSIGQLARNITERMRRDEQ